jgi:hypothetical protein
MTDLIIYICLIGAACIVAMIIVPPLSFSRKTVEVYRQQIEDIQNVQIQIAAETQEYLIHERQLYHEAQNRLMYARCIGAVINSGGDRQDSKPRAPAPVGAKTSCIACGAPLVSLSSNVHSC